MKVHFPNVCLGVATLLMLLEKRHADCFQRLLKRRLTSNEMSDRNVDDIREILTSSLTANEPRASIKNEKRDSSIEVSLEDDNNDKNNAASDSREASIYEDEGGEEDEESQRVARRVDDADESKRNSVAVDKSELANDDESDLRNVKEVAKREARNEDNYDEDDFEVDSESVDSTVETEPKVSEVARSSLEDRNSDDLRKIDSPRASSAVEGSDLDYEKRIEDQIQQRIDAIKEDIKRQIERKQRAREIEANNAKFDELEFSRDDDEVEPASSDSAKRSASDDLETMHDDARKSVPNVRSKRRSIGLSEVVESETSDGKNFAQPLKKRGYVKRVTLGQKRESAKRTARGSIIIPERGHAEVRDDLPADLTLDPKLRLARSYDEKKEPEGSRSARSAPESFEDKENETPEETNNFLFSSREVPARARHRRSRGRDRSRSPDRLQDRKHPRHLRRHRAIRESSIEDANRVEERDKRAMPFDESAALEYKESFGGFPSESGGALGRFKRIKRSAMI